MAALKGCPTAVNIMHLLLALVFVSGIQAADRTEIARLEQVWNEAHVQGNAEALDRLWAEDIVVTVPGMAPMTKADSIGVWRTGRMKFSRYDTSDIAIRVHGGTAVVTGRLHRTRSMGERVIDERLRFTKTYAMVERSWRVVAFHASVPE
jgi:ketosteroid isomerase-like protein